MSNSHFDSNVLAKDGDETIRGFATISATALSGTTISGTTGHVTTFTSNSVTASGVAVRKGSGSGYIQLGGTKTTAQFIFWGAGSTEASVVANATAITATPTGSLYITTGGTIWTFTAADAATSLAAV